MKILFVFKSENFLAPLGICGLSAVAREEGHEVSLGEMNTADIPETVAALRPDIIAYSSSTGEAKHYLRVNAKIKERFPGVFTIMGGPHPTFFPEVLDGSSLDAVCVGEGEGAFRDVLRARAQGRPVTAIPNIRARGEAAATVPRGLIDDLDSLPHPDYGLLYDHTPMGAYPLKNFMTSRGCPYSCTYCFNPAWNRLYEGKGRIVRRHSVEYVLDDIEMVRRRWPLGNVKFYDDIFCYQADEWLEEFSREYRRRIGLPFFILTRADLLTEPAVRLLKLAGCRTISMSIEAGNAGLRNTLLKRDMSDDQIITAHELCRRYGIRTFTNCIVGLPGATLANEMESIDLSIRCKADWAEFLIFHPYPRTELGEQCVRDGIFRPDYGRMHTSYMHSSPLGCFTPAEKNAQKNISALGAVAVALPWTRGIIARLIRWPHNKLFTLGYFFVKMYVIRAKIYVTRTSWAHSMKIFLRSLKQELFRHEDTDDVKG